MSEATLKPCPFCGGAGDENYPALPMMADFSDVYVRCLDCDAMGPQVLFDQDIHGESDIAGLRHEATTAWNTRAKDADQ